MIEMKINYKDILEEGGLEDLLTDKMYLLHHPNLSKLQGKGYMFKRLTLLNNSEYYVLYIERKKPNISPKIIKHYQRGRPRSENKNPSSITIKCNEMYHLVGDVFVFI